MADDLLFVIDGTEYPCPDIASLTMAERRVMFDLSGIVEEDFVQRDDETDVEKDERVGKLTRHPGFMEALMHIAYARGNPELKRPKVQAVIDQTNYLEAIEKWADAEDGEADHPVSEPTSELNGSSLSDSFGSSKNTGDGSTTGSDQPAASLSRIGALR